MLIATYVPAWGVRPFIQRRWRGPPQSLGKGLAVSDIVLCSRSLSTCLQGSQREGISPTRQGVPSRRTCQGIVWMDQKLASPFIFFATIVARALMNCS